MRSGRVSNLRGSYLLLGEVLLRLGDIDGARECASQSLHYADVTGSEFQRPRIIGLEGITSLCLGMWDDAAKAFTRSLNAVENQDSPRWARSSALALLNQGQTFLVRGMQEQAIKSFVSALDLAPDVASDMGGWWAPLPVAAHALSGLEGAFVDPGWFRAFCRRYRNAHPDKEDWGIASWYLEPTTPHAFSRSLVNGNSETPSSSEGAQSDHWVWHDPFGHCSYSAADTIGDGLEIHAANGRDLWHINLSAPRVLRPAPAGPHWALQTVCVAVSLEQPAIGGLLLWQDKENYLRLDMGTRGADEISLQGCLENEDLVIGRGRLPVSAPAGEQGSASRGPVWLRLERVGATVRALCSANGEAWYTAGSVDFPFEGEAKIQVGLHAIGAIDRTVYHGAYPDGTAILFESFKLWELVG
jgi:tetratricopeptide (TPR) repeat protein